MPNSKNSLPAPYDSWEIIPAYLPPDRDTCRFQRFVILPDGTSVPLLAVKSFEVFNCFKRFVLASGSKKTGKTLAVANRFLRHAWEIDGAHAAIIGHTMGNTKGGTWNDLTNWVIPGWVDRGFGFKVIKQGNDNVSKNPYIIIRNCHGGKSRIDLFSLDYELDVEKKFRSMRFSAIWLAEADLFTDRSVFDLLRQQLRLIGLPDDQHLFIFDCNPPIEGDMHWLHDVFRKAQDPNSRHYQANHDQYFQEFQFGLDDNPFITDWQKEEIKRSYRHDPVKYARFVNGDWVVDTEGGLFDDTFMFNIHVQGNAESPDQSEWEIPVPAEHTEFLMGGLDLGRLNHASSFICPSIDEEDRTCYTLFDELCCIQKKISVADYAKRVWERVQFWNDWMKTTYKLKDAPRWVWAADSAVFNYGQSASVNQNDAQTFYDISDGGIVLRSPPGQKARRQVAARIAMMSRLFHENRFFIAAHCAHNIGWARFLRPGRTVTETIQAGSAHRHPFDATSYAIGSQLPHELQDNQPTSVAMGVFCVE